MWCARPTHCRASGGAAEREGQQCPVIPKPEQCDHSPVQLTPVSRNKRRYQQAGDGRKRRWKKGKGKCHGTRTAVSQQQQFQDDQQEQPNAVGQWSAGDCSDHGAGGNQSDLGAERPDAGGEQNDICRRKDVGVGHADIATSSLRESDALERPDSSGAASGDGEEHVANEPVQQVDAAVMAAMGFSGFGSSRE